MLDDRLILAAAPERVGCAAAAAGDAGDAPGTPDSLLLRKRIRAMSAYRTHVRISGMT